MKALENAGYAISPNQREIVFSRKKTNTSVHAQNTAEYYDIETNQIIIERERFIIDKFNYQSPLDSIN